MIQYRRGDILDAEVDALVNTVNTVGVMGKGVALQFKRRFPDNFHFYHDACERGEVQPGRMLVFPTQRIQPRYIINFPTKRHWREKSRIEDIKKGLEDLVAQIRQLGIRSIAIPALGCGNGGLNWSEVRLLIAKSLQPLAGEVDILVYEPSEPEQKAVREAHLKAPLAALLCLAHRYTQTEPCLSETDIHHLAYILWFAGCWVGGRRKPDFREGSMGFTSSLVERLLKERLVDKYIQKVRGYRGKTAYIVPDSIAEQARVVVQKSARADKSLKLAEGWLEGFEDTFALQVLATALHVRSSLLGQDDALAIGDIANKLKAVSAVTAPRERAERVWEHIKRITEGILAVRAA